MLAVAEETRAVRSARRIQQKVDDTEKELEETQELRDDMQKLVEMCIDLSTAWRAFVKEVSDSLESKQQLDFAKLGEILRPAADKSLSGYQRIEAIVQRAREQHEIIIRDACDVTLAIVEIKNIRKWLGEWPTFDPSQRQRSHAELRSPDCQFATAADFD